MDTGSDNRGESGNTIASRDMAVQQERRHMQERRLIFWHWMPRVLLAYTKLMIIVLRFNTLEPLHTLKEALEKLADGKIKYNDFQAVLQQLVKGSKNPQLASEAELAFITLLEAFTRDLDDITARVDVSHLDP